MRFRGQMAFFLCFAATQLARQVQQERTQVCAVIKQPGSAWVEGTPAMDMVLCFLIEDRRNRGHVAIDSNYII